MVETRPRRPVHFKISPREGKLESIIKRKCSSRSHKFQKSQLHPHCPSCTLPNFSYWPPLPVQSPPLLYQMSTISQLMHVKPLQSSMAGTIRLTAYGILVAGGTRKFPWECSCEHPLNMTCQCQLHNRLRRSGRRRQVRPCNGHKCLRPYVYTSSCLCPLCRSHQREWPGFRQDYLRRGS